MLARMVVIALVGCAGGGATGPSNTTATDAGPAPTPIPTPTPGPAPTPNGGPTADVVQVNPSGSAGAYTFGVAIRSDETGCAQYADWWEVLSEEGDLVFRRILTHSHPTEQPFERPGGPVAIAGDTPVWVRAHLHPDGYVGALMHGTVDGGFVPADPGDGFAADLEDEPPQPESCLF